jgi:hypothetical protein
MRIQLIKPNGNQVVRSGGYNGGMADADQAIVGRCGDTGASAGPEGYGCEQQYVYCTEYFGIMSFWFHRYPF